MKLIEKWSRTNTQGRSSAQLVSEIQSTMDGIKSFTRLSYKELKNDELEGATPAEPRLESGARFLFGVTPRVEGLRGGVAPGNSVAVLLEIERDASDDVDFQLPRPPDEQIVGRRYIYPTERAIFAVYSDESTPMAREQLSRQFQSADGSVASFGDPVLRDSDGDSRVTELSGVPRDSTLLTRFYWSK